MLGCVGTDSLGKDLVNSLKNNGVNKTEGETLLGKFYERITESNWHEFMTFCGLLKKTTKIPLCGTTFLLRINVGSVRFLIF